MAMMSLQAAYDQARSYLEANQVELAIGVAQHILTHFSENLEAHRILGEAYLASRQLDQAEAAFSRVLQADPENIPAHVGLGFTYERQGRLDRAVAEFEQALEMRPDMSELRAQLLRLYTDLWGAEGATLRLSRPGLARLYAKGHMLPQAIQEFRGVIDEMPDRFDARVGLAEALWRDGQEDAAIETCETILAERPGVLKANLLLGYIKLARGDASGESYWRIAQHSDPQQQVARALFETLPDLPGPDLSLEAWDEQAWLARQAQEEEQRHRAPALTAATTAAEPDPFDSWIDQVDEPAAASAATIPEDDDFLASLLASNTPPVPEDLGSDLDSSSGVQPFSFDELGMSALETSASPASIEPEAVEELEPFSLADLGLSPDDLDLFARSGSEPPAEELEPFSLADLGLSPDDLDLFARSGSEPPAEELEPFSLADLGLSPDEIAGLNAASTPTDEPALEPFSLADLGLSPDEIAGLSSTTVPDPDGSPLDLTPFSLDELDLEPEPGSQSQPEPAGLNVEPFNWDINTPEGDMGNELGDLQPFSLDDLDLNATSDDHDFGSLPPSLQPFSLDDMAQPPILPPSSGDEQQELAETGGYSWQQPSAKRSTDFLPGEERETPKDSIFGRLSKQAAERPVEEPPPLPSVSDEEAEAAGYFSNDDVSLRDDGSTTTERFAGGFRLPREGEPAETPSAGLIAGAATVGGLATAAASKQEPPAEPPASEDSILEPFSLADLGLSPDEIALLEAAKEAASQPAATPQEPTLEPFSLADLGLSSDEIAQLDAANKGELPFPVTGETIVPGWSRGEQPELTPFAADEPVASAEAATDFGDVEPFSFDDFDLESAATAAIPAATTGGAEFDDAVAGVEPFSLDDLGLDEFSAGLESDRQLGVTDEELATLDLGELESLANETRPTTPLVSEDPAAAMEHLLALGRSQGYVDLTDIISMVSDPEAEAERIEELGWALHNAGIQIRDGDEIIDMEGDLEEEAAEATFDQRFVESEASSAPSISVDAEPDLTPFSLDDLGLSEEEIVALGLSDTPPPAPVQESAIDAFNFDDFGLTDEPPAAPAPDEPVLEPFSLADLGLSPEEIAMLEAAQAGEPAAPAPDEPVLEPFSLADLGLSPDEIAMLEAAQGGEPAAPTPDEPVLEPFSLADLGLSPDEIAMLEAAQGGETETGGDKPSLEPFSLADLGLSPEEIAMLEQAAREEAAFAAEQSTLATPPSEPDADDPLNFDLDEVAVVARAKRTEPRAEEPPPAVDPADASFVPEPLESLDDIWHLPESTKPVDAAPARVVLPPIGERKREPAPAAAARPAREHSSMSRDEERFARREAVAQRGRGAERPARSMGRGAARSVAEFASFLPTGNQMLDEYLGQLDEEPDNYGLALAIGHLCAETNRTEIMTLAFKRIVRSGQGVDQLAEDLEGLLAKTDDPTMKQQLTRLLGDAYSKQGRYREAMAAYGATFGQ